MALRSTRPPLAQYSSTAYWALSLAVCVVFSGILAAAGFPLSSVFLGFVLIAICGYPTFDYFRVDSKEVPAIPVLSGIFALQFAMPVFLSQRRLMLSEGPRALPEEAIVHALILAIIGTVAFITVCRSKLAAATVGQLPALRLHLNEQRAIVFCVTVGALGLLAAALFPEADGVSSQLGAIVRVVRNQMLVAIAVLAWLYYSSRSRVIGTIWYGMIALAVIAGMSSAFLEAALAPVGIMFICQWLYGRRINKWLLASVVAVVLFLNPVKAEVRQALWFGSGGTPDASRVEKALFWLDRATTHWLGIIQGRATGNEAAEQLASRLNMVAMLAWISDQTPEPVPYLEGDTYAFVTYFLIPRLLWPEKPEARANKVLSVRYNLTTEAGAERTTFGIGLLGEGYANFGAVGVVLISAVLGLVLVVMMRLFGRADAGAGGAAILISFFIYFLNGMGSSAEILFGNLFQSMLASYLLLYWAAEKHPARSRVVRQR